MKIVPTKSLVLALLLAAPCPSLVAKGTVEPVEHAALTGDWGGLRSSLEERGVTLGIEYTGEVLGNATGGLRTGTIYAGLLVVDLELNLEKLAGWRGGTIYGSFFYPHGDSISGRFAGDLGVASNIDFYDSPRLFEAWLEQAVEFGDARVSLRAGQLAADGEFWLVDPAGIFLNSGFGVPTAVSGNFPVPIFAISSLGARLDWKLGKPGERQFIARVGVFDGNPATGMLGDFSPRAALSREYDHHGIDWALRHDEGALIAAEFQVLVNQPTDEPPAAADGKSAKAVAPARGLAGAYTLGFIHHTDTFSNIYDTQLLGLGSSIAPVDPRGKSGNTALYASIDQEVWREPGTETQGAHVFLRGVAAQQERNFFDYSAEAGVTFAGLIPQRDDDVFGIAAAFYHISPRVGSATRAANRADGTDESPQDYELVVECTYRAQITKWLTVQPDLQWIIHPGGSDALDNALVIGIRTTITF